MAVNAELVAEKIFNVLKGFGYPVKSFDVNGKIVINPQEATRFAVADPNILVRLDLNSETISLATSESQQDEKLRSMLKNISRDYLMNFDYRRFNKKLKPKSENIDVAQNSEIEMADVMEGFGVMTGSSKTSYQPLDNVKIIVKHKKAVSEEVRGARSRNIHSIYIQRGDERFKMAENSLKAARAMARHINMGGEVFDTVGTAITEMAAEQRKLSEFVRYVNKAGLVNESNQEYVILATETINHIKSSFERLAGVKTYANAVEGIDDYANIEVLNDDIDLEGQFIETHFDDRVAEAMNSIKRGMARQQHYRNEITTAIKNEDFANLKNMLNETEVLDFATPHAKLSYQVSQLSNAAQNATLKNHLSGISKKLAGGQTLDQFDYSTVKSCLLSAHEAKIKPEMAESAEDSYEKFIETFDIL